MHLRVANVVSRLFPARLRLSLWNPQVFDLALRYGPSFGRPPQEIGVRLTSVGVKLRSHKRQFGNLLR